MDWEEEDIINSFNGIIRDARIMNVNDLEFKYKKFRESFSKLYDVAIDAIVTGQVQEATTMLQMMLKARSSMQDGKMSKLTTDMFVGNQLGKKYIYPKTNNPSQDDYIKAIATINETVKKNEDQDKLEKEKEKEKALADTAMYGKKVNIVSSASVEDLTSLGANLLEKTEEKNVYCARVKDENMQKIAAVSSSVKYDHS